MNPYGFAVEAQFARVGPQKTRKNFHEGAFPGSVLPEDTLDAARGNGQGDRVVGLEGAETFGNILQFDRH
jgi:hypothetical protein